MFTFTEDITRSSQLIASVNTFHPIGRIVRIIQITIKYIGRFFIERYLYDINFLGILKPFLDAINGKIKVPQFLVMCQLN